MKQLSVVLLALSLTGAWSAARAEDAPAGKAIVKIHEGKHWIWLARQDQFDKHKDDLEPFYDYADKAFEDLVKLWGLPMPENSYALLVRPEPGGGFATGDVLEAHPVTHRATPGIGVSFDAFYNEANGVKGYWGYAILTHEMVNLFTGKLVSGGWPLDWWADHRSPFPLMTAVQIETDLIPKVAATHAKQLSGDVEKMFTQLRDDIGWPLFVRAFKAAKDDGMNWDRIGKNPSALRTNYVCAYLQIGAEKDLEKYIKGVLKEYSAQTVADIVKAREAWKALPESDPKRAKLRDAFLHGDYGGK